MEWQSLPKPFAGWLLSRPFSLTCCVSGVAAPFFFFSIPVPNPVLSSAVASGLRERSGSNIRSSPGRGKAQWLVFPECLRQRDRREMQGRECLVGAGSACLEGEDLTPNTGILLVVPPPTSLYVCMYHYYALPNTQDM